LHCPDATPVTEAQDQPYPLGLVVFNLEIEKGVNSVLNSRDRRGHSLEGRAQGGLLSEVGFHHVDHLIGRKSLFRIRPSLRVKDVVPDVAFQELSHQAVDCPSRRTDDL
jgi:hypothetical protein